MENPVNKETETATLAAGCFWCVEAIFEKLEGVLSVTSGYSGGFVINPAYREVCNGTTGHAEAVQVVFDPKTIRFSEILDVFWKTHDPTTLNRQGADVGSQYRSAIFYHNEEQREIAEKSKQSLEESGFYPNPVVTEITPFKNFYKAESHHQEYYAKNPEQPYCSIVIAPKLDKMGKLFSDKLRDK